MENEEGCPGRARTAPAENELAANIPRCVSSVWPVLARVLAAAQVRGGVPSESWVPGSLWGVRGGFRASRNPLEAFYLPCTIYSLNAPKAPKPPESFPRFPPARLASGSRETAT